MIFVPSVLDNQFIDIFISFSTGLSCFSICILKDFNHDQESSKLGILIVLQLYAAIYLVSSHEYIASNDQSLLFHTWYLNQLVLELYCDQLASGAVTSFINSNDDIHVILSHQANDIIEFIFISILDEFPALSSHIDGKLSRLFVVQLKLFQL
ncbi:MAG: hypothetical protein U9Q66_00560 [Patescibacteria group bacterium]|nr:hypothetical protein [Patescibacteria group bacterium]